MPASTISDFVRPNGSLNYMLTKKFAQKHSADEFAAVFNRPILVGSSVYSGDLKESKTGNTTMFFNLKDIEEKKKSEASSALMTAIFPIYKTKRGDGKPNVVTIGRANENDLVMNDYPVSREHGQIRVQGLQYFLKDYGTTNGTTINEKSLPANTEKELFYGDILGFGRYRFHFMSAKMLHKKLCK